MQEILRFSGAGISRFDLELWVLSGWLAARCDIELGVERLQLSVA